MEELGVEAQIGGKIGTNKVFLPGQLWQGEYYEVILLGEPKIQESNKHEKLEFISLLQDENGEKILKSETEKSSDQDFIKKNFDINVLTENNFFNGEISILAWTTTPWTIPANMALVVGKDIDYILAENNGEQFIVAKNRAEAVFKGK